MIYALFTCLLLLTVFIYYVQGKNLLSPSFIVSSVFTISSFFAMYSAGTWGVTLDIITPLVILSGILSLALGEILARTSSRKRLRGLMQKSSKSLRDVQPISMPRLFTFLVIVLMTTMLTYVYTQVKIASMATGGSGEIATLINDARYTIVSGEASIGSLAITCSLLAKSFFAIYSFVFIYNLVYCGRTRRNLTNLLPVVTYLPFVILSTGRTEFIYMIVYSVVIYGIMRYKKTGSLSKTNAGLAKVGVIALVSFLLIFMAVGNLTGKSQALGSSAIPIYVGSSIPALDRYLKSNDKLNESNYFGNHTLFGIYSWLNKLGFDVPLLSPPYEFTYFSDGTSTNIYTSLRRYIQDYTLVGMLAIMLILGFVYQKLLYKTLIPTQNSHLWLMTYALICFPLFEASIEERFFMHVTGPTVALLLLFVVTQYYLLIKNRIVHTP